MSLTVVIDGTRSGKSAHCRAAGAGDGRAAAPDVLFKLRLYSVLNQTFSGAPSG